MRKRSWRMSLRCVLFHRRWWRATLLIVGRKFARDVRCMWCAAHWCVVVADLPVGEFVQVDLTPQGKAQA